MNGEVKMLEEMIKNGYGKEEKMVCSELILNGSNEVFSLGLNEDAMRLSAAFGGGMYTGGTCGAVVSALMVIGYMNTESYAKHSPAMKEKVIEFQEIVTKELGSINCIELKDMHYDDTIGCQKVYTEVARLLEEFVKEAK